MQVNTKEVYEEVRVEADTTTLANLDDNTVRLIHNALALCTAREAHVLCRTLEDHPAVARRAKKVQVAVGGAPILCDTTQVVLDFQMETSLPGVKVEPHWRRTTTEVIQAKATPVRTCTVELSDREVVALRALAGPQDKSMGLERLYIDLSTHPVVHEAKAHLDASSLALVNRQVRATPSVLQHFSNKR